MYSLDEKDVSHCSDISGENHSSSGLSGDSIPLDSTKTQSFNNTDEIVDSDQYDNKISSPNNNNNNNNNNNSSGGDRDEKTTKYSNDKVVKKSFFGIFKREPKKNESKPQSIPLLKLFRFADKSDISLIIVGCISSIIVGIVMPLMTIILSTLIGGFLEYGTLISDGKDYEADSLLKRIINKYCLYFLGLGLGMWIAATIQRASWGITSERQGRRIREIFYASILRQDISWFDEISTGELTSRISVDVNIIQDGISEKFGYSIQHISTFVGGLIIALVKGWKLALVIMAAMPMLVLSFGIMSIVLSYNTVKGQDSYAEAGGVATEVLSSIKTIMAFGGEERELSRYNTKIVEARASGVRKGIITGICMGFSMFIFFGVYALGFWYGGKLINKGEMDTSEVINVFLGIMFGGTALGSTAPNITAISSARGAAVKLYEIIDRESLIDAVDDSKGLTAENITGEIELSGVDFRYPARPNVQILKNFNLHVKPGQKVALVGESGCGKSTAISLIERFYDPEKGIVKIDGVDIREYNVRSLRQQIGVIMQMPVLFGHSIYQNIIWGAIDSELDPPTMDEVIQACKDANAHDFISELPDGYDTLVGERGALLSGGQKQRIAIARALVRNPKILLLDEATSALDTSAERIVQEALDRASVNRTTVTIAHRLSTIMDSDVIYVVSKGNVIEAGNHEELVEYGGAYAKLVDAQKLRQGMDNDDANDESDSANDLDDALISHEIEPRPLDAKDTRISTRQFGNALNKPSIQCVGTMHSVALSAEQYNGDVDRIVAEAKKSWLKRMLIKIGGKGVYSLFALIHMNKKDTTMLIPGAIGALAKGASMPCFALIFTHLLTSLQEQDKDKQEKDITLYSGIVVGYAFAVFIAMAIRVTFFSWTGEKVTYNVRYDLFKAMMNQEAEYFDKKENGTGALTARLSSDAGDVNKCIGDAFPTYFDGLGAIIAGASIAFMYDWHLTLVIIAILPILAYSIYITGRAMHGSTEMMRTVHERASQDAAETVANIRTVVTLTREHSFIENFRRSNGVAHMNAVRNHIIGSIGYGFSQGAPLFINGFIYFVGSRLVIKELIEIQDMFNVMFSILFVATVLGEVAQQSAVVNKAVIASTGLLTTIKSIPKIDVQSEDGVKMDSANVSGTVSLQNVKFAYPTRPNAQILRGVNINVLPGKTVAFVGPSGSGKSTIIGLIQRLYDVRTGNVKVEDADVRNWNIKSLRENLALVGQEPVLLDYTIGENIAYGNIAATHKDVEEAAIQANIHNFVVDLPDGYNTQIGQLGGRLSGGQKQRIAIARALIRKPKILLLDEASSALDSQSEKLVQAALDKAAQGRTTIVIAHRLSTIQNADLIAVFKQGKVVEQGTHDELIAMKGLYSLLVTQQSLQITH